MVMFGAPGATQRASDIAQLQITGESAAILARKRADAAERLRRDKVRYERDQRRRQSEHHAEQHQETKSDAGSLLDVIV